MVATKSFGEIFNIEKGSLQSSKCKPGEYTFITASSEWKTNTTFSHDCEAIVMAVAASGSLGRAHYYEGKFIASDLCLILTPKNNKEVNLKFFYYFLNFFRERIVKATAIGTSKISINGNKLRNFKVIFPDIETQNAFLKNMEFMDSKYSALNLCFEDSGNCLIKLRQAILQDAFSGKLVPQDPNDEPVYELLKKTKDEKERLIGEEKIKKERYMPPIAQELPFDLPTGWAWVRFGDLTESMKNGLYKPSRFYGPGIPCLRMYNIEEGKIVWKNIREMILSESEAIEYGLQENDILLNRINSRELVGKAAVIPKGLGKVVFEAMNIRIRVRKNLVIPKYICYFLLTQYARDQIESSCKQTVGMATVSQEDIRNWGVPYAALGEQQRIVQKIDALMRLCDELEQKVKENQQDARFLMEAVLKEAFAS